MPQSEFYHLTLSLLSLSLIAICSMIAYASLPPPAAVGKKSKLVAKSLGSAARTALSEGTAKSTKVCIVSFF